jgi:hypothetical protein
MSSTGDVVLATAIRTQPIPARCWFRAARQSPWHCSRDRSYSRTHERVSSTSSRCDQFDGVADFDATCPIDSSVQTEFAAKAPDDLTQNARILLGRLGIVRRHHATAPEVSETDLRFRQPQNRARPRPLGQTFNAADLSTVKSSSHCYTDAADTGAMLAFNRKKLLGSYFALMRRRRVMFAPYAVDASAAAVSSA